MHLVEQLHVKRTDAHQHVVSRKRKLAQLFAATVFAGELPIPSTTPSYTQQLQRFQEANDLLNGRTFDESTLPPRSRIIHQQRGIPTPSIHVYPSKQPSSFRELKSPSQPDANNLSNSKDSKPLGTKKSPDASRGSEDPTPPAVDDVQRQIPKQDLDTHGHDGKGLAFKDEERSIIAVSSGSTDSTNVITPDLGRGHAVHDVVAPVPPTDAPSSPESTNDPPSSSTPVPTTGSPSTSLGNEELSGSAIIDADKRHGADSDQQPQTPEAIIAPHLHKLSVSSLDVDTMEIDPSTAFDSPIQSNIPQITIQREASTRPRPPIRVDTQHELGPAFQPQAITSGAFVETPMLMTGTTETPQHAIPATPLSAVDSLKRATRISSGALQKKSVSEILGGTPKSNSLVSESSLMTMKRDDFTTTTAQARQLDRERKEKERIKLSTVVFAKPQRPTVDLDTTEISEKTGLGLENSNPEERDYLYTLFESKAYSSKSGNLTHLIQHAHKTVTTADHLVDYEYQAQCRVLKRLYQLQSADRWALRQRKRAEEPSRPTSHWDFLLDHMKWMRTDFREERKWKHAAALFLAEACAEWVASNAEERKQLQVQIRHAKPQIIHDSDRDVVMEDSTAESHPTPELLASGEEDSVSDDIADPHDIPLAAAPAAIFSLGAGEFNFVADKTPAFDKIINELPLYEPAKIEPDFSKSNLAERMDARWKTDIVPVSRFATEKLRVKDSPASFSKTRYDYDPESVQHHDTTPLPPREANVGLFMPENKHIRDRIHPGHSFRPPSEHPMPTQAFFETRASSQWTPTEDDELRKLVKDYSYNWSLISSCLSPKSLYHSSADRRTPWECFERWIGLEGMPADMAKTPYFRTYSGRIEAAGRHLQAQIEEAQRRAGANAPVIARKRTSQPVRVERKRAQRHLAMLDAMRKLAKKRETLQQKQKASAEMAASRGKNEMNNQQRPPLKTPAEWSLLKHEREQKMAKQQELYRQQLIAHQRAATAQQHRGPNGAANGITNNMQAARGSTGAPVQMANGHLAVPNGVPRPHPSMLGVPNGMPMPAGMAGQKAIQAQMQANMRAGMNGSPQQLRIQEQLMRQAQQNGAHSSPNAVHGNVHGPAFSGDGNNVNGQPSPSGVAGTSSTSPRQPGVGQALSSGHVPVLTQIAASIKQRHPNMSDEDIQRAASQQLTTWQQQATAAAAGQAPRPRVNQAALNAALGAANAAAHAGSLAAATAAAGTGGYPPGQGIMTAEQLQQYNQRLRLQQAQQHVARGQMQQNMINQMNNAAAMNMSRPVSQHANQQNMSRSGTPRDQRPGSASNVNAAPSPSTNGNGSSPMSGVQQQSAASPARPTSQQTMQT